MGIVLYRALAGATLLFFTSISIVGKAMSLSVDDIIRFSPLFCPLKVFLNLECLTCGMSRAFVSWLLYGPEYATQFNSLSIVLFPLTLLLLIVSCFWPARVIATFDELSKKFLAKQQAFAATFLFAIFILVTVLFQN